MCILNLNPPSLTALVKNVGHRGWRSVWVTDDSAAFLGWDRMYQELCGLEFSNLYRSDALAELNVAGRKQYLEQLAQGLRNLSAEKLGQWLDANVQLMPGLREFLAAMSPDQGLVIVGDNFGYLLQRILTNYKLETIPFIGPTLKRDGMVTAWSDRVSKALVCQALLRETIWVTGISGTRKTIDYDLLMYANTVDIPVVCFREPGRFRLSASTWEELIPWVHEDVGFVQDIEPPLQNTS